MITMLTLRGRGTAVGLFAASLWLSGCGSTTASAPTSFSIHVLRGNPGEAATLSSYGVDADGRLRFIEARSVGAARLLGVDPRGRFVYLTDDERLRSYSVDPSRGTLTPRGELPIEHSISRAPDVKGPAALAVTEEYGYLSAGWYRYGSRTLFERFTVAVDASGALTSRGVENLRFDLDSGADMAVDRDARVLYQRRGTSGVSARRILADGTTSAIAETALPEPDDIEWPDEIVVVQGVLVATSSSRDRLLALVLDQDGRAFRQGSYLSGNFSGLVPFGSGGILTGGTDGRSPVTLHQVGVDGTLAIDHVVPDPNLYYSGFRTAMGFHSSWRFAYRATWTTVQAFAVGPDAQLSLLEEMPEPGSAARQPTGALSIQMVIAEPRS